MKKNIILDDEHLKVDDFNLGYFKLHSLLSNEGNKEESRNGDTFEILNFKTKITNPYRRCVGGYGRNVNIFFLLAEALWIWAGRKDVAFLKLFNNQMGEYSDNGTDFYAAYGFRMRHYGIDSNTIIDDSSKHHHSQSIDQIKKALLMLEKNPQDRRVVISIWNAELDLGTISKDLPCNDLLMLKVRNGELHSTIANRSNDLDWGLVTNIFQFSFITELMSNILGVGLGTQVHNSQSLHLYKDNPLTEQLELNQRVDYFATECDFESKTFAKPISINFSKANQKATDKLEEVDWYVKGMISKLVFAVDSDLKNSELTLFKENLKNFSTQLFNIFELLEIYLRYKNKEINRIETFKEILKQKAMSHIVEIEQYQMLALNFFAKRFNEGEKAQVEPIIKSELILENIGNY